MSHSSIFLYALLRKHRGGGLLAAVTCHKRGNVKLLHSKSQVVCLSAKRNCSTILVFTCTCVSQVFRPRISSIFESIGFQMNVGKTPFFRQCAVVDAPSDNPTFPPSFHISQITLTYFITICKNPPFTSGPNYNSAPIFEQSFNIFHSTPIFTQPPSISNPLS